jgi:2-iminobutanoate/2-iminopropanoate deaminase
LDAVKALERITADGVGRLATFSHATRAGDWIYVSGTLGTKPGAFALVEGGMAAETRQTLENLRAILAAAGAGLEDVVKMQVFVTDMTRFSEMNQAYREFFPNEPPSRVTVGCSALALGACVEIDCVAYKPSR